MGADQSDFVELYSYSLRLPIGVAGGDIYHISSAGGKQNNVVRGEKPLTLFLSSSFRVKR